LVGAALRPLYGALRRGARRCQRVTERGPALSGCAPRRTIPAGLVTESDRDPTQGGGEGGREFSLPGSLALPPCPELRIHRPGRELPSLPYAPETPDFRVRRHHGAPPSLTVRPFGRSPCVTDVEGRWRESGVSPTCSSSFDSGVEVTRRTLNGHRVRRSRHAPRPQNPAATGRSGARQTLRHEHPG
jgi:hypothetical protein